MEEYDINFDWHYAMSEDRQDFISGLHEALDINCFNCEWHKKEECPVYELSNSIDAITFYCASFNEKANNEILIRKCK